MIEKGSMFKAWEATTEQQKKAHEMQAIYKAQETARQAIQEAMNRYIKKKTRARSVAKAETDPFAELEGWESLEQIQEAYGYGEITSDRRDKLTDLWEAREAAQRKGKKDGKYHDLVTDMLARAIHSVGNEYADEIAAYEEERRMRRSYYEKVENMANGLQEEEPDPLSPAKAALVASMKTAKVELAKCPFCHKNAVYIGVCDNEGNFHGRMGCEYERNPWSGLTYNLHHEGWGECILCTDGDDLSMGGKLFDTAEDAANAWNEGDLNHGRKKNPNVHL